MSVDYVIGFAAGAIVATALFTLGFDFILFLLKKEVQVIDKQQTNREVKS